MTDKLMKKYHKKLYKKLKSLGIIKKLKRFYIDEYEDEYLVTAADKYKIPLRTGRLKDYVDPNLYNYSTPYSERHTKLTTPESFNFHLKTIKTIFKTWEQDINDISIKNVGTCRIVSGYPYYSNNCKKPSCVLVESNGRN